MLLCSVQKKSSPHRGTNPGAGKRWAMFLVLFCSPILEIERPEVNEESDIFTLGGWYFSLGN